ncbi:MAG TPA: SgcJ/EcaC family oxidoreductase [Thiobacillus sp.]
MDKHEVIYAIERADQAINQRDMAALMDFYAEDATLVVEPGRCAHGKEQIAKAFGAIFAYFNQSLSVTQRDFHVIEGGGVALVVCKLKLSAQGMETSRVSMERKPTYIFRKSEDGKWRCLIDNSYGVDL